MLSLGINTALKNSSVCLCRDGVVLEEREWKSAQNESAMLLPSIVEMMKKHDLEPSDLNAVLVVSGPGSFTALRIGVITANTLAAELNIPLYALDSFKFLRLRAQQDFEAVVMHAGANMIYVVENEDHCKDPTICDFDEWQQNAAEGEYLLDLSEKQYAKLDKKIRPLEKMDGFGEFCVKIFSNKQFDLSEFLVNPLPLSPNYVKPPAITM